MMCDNWTFTRVVYQPSLGHKGSCLCFVLTLCVCVCAQTCVLQLWWSWMVMTSGSHRGGNWQRETLFRWLYSIKENLSLMQSLLEILITFYWQQYFQWFISMNMCHIFTFAFYIHAGASVVLRHSNVWQNTICWHDNHNRFRHHGCTLKRLILYATRKLCLIHRTIKMFQPTDHHHLCLSVVSKLKSYVTN